MRATPKPATETSETDNERREYDRQQSGVRLIIVRPQYGLVTASNGNNKHLTGWSRDISPGGLCFLCLSQITDETVWIRTEESPDWYGEVQIIRSRELIEGLWEYGGKLKRMIPRFLD